MKTYFSTFITGFSEVVEQTLRECIKDVEIELLSDGIVVYKTGVKLERIKELRFFNNSFLLFTFFPKLGNRPIEEMLKQTINDRNIISSVTNSLPKKQLTFRVMATVENQFAGMDKALKEKLEQKIARRKMLTLDRSNPDIEFLFVTRSEGFGIFGLRLTSHTSYEKTLEKGELYPELAHILCVFRHHNLQITTTTTLY